MHELKLVKSIQTLLSRQIQKELLPEFWLVTITKIRISKDFSYADIYVSAIPTNTNVVDFLKSKVWHYQKSINCACKRKVVPKIRFHYDETWEFVSSIDKLID